MSAQEPPNAAFVTDTSASPESRLRPVPLGAVALTTGFWAERVRLNRDVSIPLMLERLRSHHVLDNFLRLCGRCDRPRERRLATDSDLYKWLEAACYALANREDRGLRQQVEDVIEAVLPAQEASGYLNTSMVEANRERRWEDFHAHELYCAGHMFQAAV
ncbi:MAG: glycoside hydrolase family 127 protein, partial [Candidatus Brocadiaceae bacterium]